MQRTPLVLISGKDVLAAGGHETYVRAHALAAVRIGFDPHIFCASTAGATEPTDFGVIHRIAAPSYRPPPALLQIPLPAQLPLLARAVTTFLASRPGPHLIHGFSIFAAAGVLASRALARRGINPVPVAGAYATRAYEIGVILDLLGAHFELADQLRYRVRHRWIQSVDNAIEGWGYAGSRVVLVNYESVRRTLVSAYGPGLRIRRVPYAAPNAFADQRPVTAPVPAPVARLDPPGAPLIVAVSRHSPRKGVDVLLLALAEVAGAGIPFRACIVGPGVALTRNRRLALRLGLDRSVAQPGYVPGVAPYLSAADIFVLPSLSECSGSVSVLEALRAGKPVIASACDGLPEDLLDGQDSLLVTPGDVSALAGALKHLLTDPGQRARLATGARATHARRFSVDGFVTALAEVYAEFTRLPAAATTTMRSGPGGM
jgi:glycosyltransferase involved in cell wall biosynthesis